MKSIQRIVILTACLMHFALLAAEAQVYYAPKERSVEITPYAGYMLNTNMTVAYGYVNTRDNPAFGGTIAFDVQRGMQVELQYLYHSTTSDFISQSGRYDDFGFDVTMQYFMLNFVREIKPMAKVNPYVSVEGGAVWAQPKYASLESVWRAAMQLGGGAKISLSEKIALKLQGQVLFPLVFYGGGFYVGTGGAGLGVSAGIPFAEFNFSGGLSFSL